MNTKEFDPIGPANFATERKARIIRRDTGPSLAAAGLGVVCVLGVFALLGLLYSLG